MNHQNTLNSGDKSLLDTNDRLVQFYIVFKSYTDLFRWAIGAKPGHEYNLTIQSSIMPSSSLQSSCIEIAAVREFDLPVIDISQFPNEFEFGDRLQYHHPEVTKLGEACRDWGIFRIGNHGISADLLQKAESVCKELLSMPTEAKDRATTCIPLDSYFRNSNFEAFSILDLPNSDSVLEMSKKIWPQQGNSIFCETIGAYSESVTALAQKITRAILASLGLDVESFYKSDFEKSKPYLRINGYSSHGKSFGEEALVSHADTGFLTIIYQEEKEGFQIRSKEGKWIGVKPESNSLIVNVGDSFKAWSNGRYRSVHHRVVTCKGWTHRMAIAMFSVFPDDKEIWAPAQLVDKQNHVRRYRPFKYSDFKLRIRDNNMDKDKINVLERFAGI